MRTVTIVRVQEISFKKLIKSNQSLHLRVQAANMLKMLDKHILLCRLEHTGLGDNMKYIQKIYNKADRKQVLLDLFTATLKKGRFCDEHDYGLSVDVGGTIYWSPGPPAPRNN